MSNNTMMLILALLIEAFYVFLALALMFWSLALLLRVWCLWLELEGRRDLRWAEAQEEIERLWFLVLRVWLVLYLMVLLETLLVKVCGVACLLRWNEPDVAPVEELDSQEDA
jgi:drug/metabolite transporter (DMT)-like permease